MIQTINKGKICRFGACDNQAHSRGYCSGHYSQQYKGQELRPLIDREYLGLSKSPEYTVWEGMIQRTTNPNYKQYKDYGGRGIKVCDRWRKFSAFYEDMGERASKSMLLERIDNDKGYCKENCKWATRKEQQKNRRRQSIRLDNTSGCAGVTYLKRTGKWQSRIGVNGSRLLIGTFNELEDAVNARKQAEIKYWN